MMNNHRNVWRQFLLQLTITLFAFCGCNKDKFRAENNFENTIDFKNLQVGQKAFYVMYTANSYTYLDDFRYTGDSLKLEIKKSDAGNLILEETVSKFSKNHDYFIDPLEMQIESNPELILVPPKIEASLLFYYTKDRIQFNLNNEIRKSNLETIEDIAETPFNGNELKYIENFQFGNISISDKQIITREGFGIKRAYIAYDEKGIQLSHVTSDNPDHPVVGWVRL